MEGEGREILYLSAPILKEILEWAEKEDMDEITEDKFRQAVGGRLTRDQVSMVNAALWGFLSNGISGPAEAAFKRASTLNGLDAWRRMARYIDHGRGIRLETLRREAKMLHMRPIKNLDGVEQGITEFENTLIEYAQAGGTAMSDEEMKSDLLAILPLELRETLLWRAQEEGSFSKFRDHVILQTSKILMNRQRLPVHAVGDEPEAHGEDQVTLASLLDNVSSMEELVAAVQRLQGRRFGNRKTPPPPPNRKKDDPTRPPRRCPNCGGTHDDRKCPKAPVDVGKRPCWNCGEPGHVSSKCPAKSVRAIEDGTVAHMEDLKAFFMVDDDGHQEVRGKKARGTTRPMPTTRTLGDYLSKSTFAALGEPRGATTRSGARSRVPADEAVAPKPRTDPAKVSLRDATARALADAQKIMHMEDAEGSVNVLYDDEEEILAAATEHVTIRAAMDSGSVDNVIHPQELPCDADPVPNTTGKHFVGANNSKIQKFGHCKTRLKSQHGQVGCDWQLADVTRPLHSVSKVTGPMDGPGKQDVLFSNKKCVVVPPGIVEEILKRVKPVAEYPREGNLYVGEFTMSTFGRPSQDP